jgi:hypothetical protein
MGYVMIRKTSIEDEMIISASRISGVAPLMVHFDTNYDDTSLQYSADFHEYLYTWDFDDSGTWWNGKSKNKAIGALAAHVFETPGVYTVSCIKKSGITVIGYDEIEITVSDPDTVYAGTATTCVNPDGDDDFTNAPADSRHVSTDDLTIITQYATEGSRVLFKRGCSWTVPSVLSWPNTTGSNPTIIGAYGTGVEADSQGIYSNNPSFTVSDNIGFMSLSGKRNYKVMDLTIIGYSSHAVLGGAETQQDQLLLRLNVSGGTVAVNWTTWNDADCTQNDLLGMVSCNMSNNGIYNVYTVSQRLVSLGNIIEGLTGGAAEHSYRVGMSWKGVISNNRTSGAGATYDHFTLRSQSIGTPAPGTSTITKYTEYTILSDNIFGGSGSFSVTLYPNTGQDGRLSNIIFERNLLSTQHNPSVTKVNSLIHAALRHSTIRNNIFDMTGCATDENCQAIGLLQLSGTPAPEQVYVYNNTAYRGDESSLTQRFITIEESVISATIRNNLISCPNNIGSVVTVYNLSEGEITESNNQSIDDPEFIDPDNETPLSRDFNIGAISTAISAGTVVPVYEDFEENIRPNGDYDIGAYEYYE